MSELVECRFCQHLNQTRCRPKKAKVKPNKKRKCSLYKQVDKIELKGTARPQGSPWVKAKPVRRAEDLLTGDPKHPLTGDLSRFVKSTASK